MANRVTAYNPFFAKDGQASRPRLAEYMWGSTSVGDQRPGISTPKTAINLREIYRLVEMCSSLDKAVMTIRDYSFKDGIEWVPKFSLRCRQCKYESPRLTRPVSCDKCNQPDTLVPPNEDERKNADAMFRRMDRNGNTLMAVLRMLSFHLNVADDGYLILPSDYQLDPKGNIVDWVPRRDVMVADPRNFRRVTDPTTGLLGGKWYVCLRHRPTRRLDERTGQYTRTGQAAQNPGTCDETHNGVKCGMRLYDVWYVSLDPTYSQEEPAEFYIGDVEMPDGVVIQEVVHESKFHPSYDGGRSPIVALWHIANALVDSEKFMGTYYKEERMPRKMMWVPTSNFKGLQAVIEEAKNRNVSQNGHYMPVIPFDPGVTAGARPVQVTDLDPLPAELQYIQVREEFHRRVAMAYDITPPFHGGVEMVGGQAQTNPLQWQVTVLGVQKEQSIYNNKYLPAILSWVKVKESSLILKTPDEDDLMRKFQVKLLESQDAMMKMQLMFPPTGIDSAGHFIFPDKPQGSMPGMPGVSPPGGGANPESEAEKQQAQGGDAHRDEAGVGKPGTQGAEEDRGKVGLPKRLTP